MFLYLQIMFKSRFLRKILQPGAEKTKQVNLVYVLSLLVGLLSGLAAIILKNAIHYTHHKYINLLIGGVIPGILIFLFPIKDLLYMTGIIDSVFRRIDINK